MEEKADAGGYRGPRLQCAVRRDGHAQANEFLLQVQEELGVEKLGLHEDGQDGEGNPQAGHFEVSMKNI